MSQNNDEQRLHDIMNAVSALPQEQRQEFLTLAENFLAQATSPKLPEKPRRKQMYKPGTDVVAHFKNTWGQYTTYYNPKLKKDIIFRDYLWTHDPKFMRKLYNRLTYLHSCDPLKHPTPEQVIKRVEDRNSQELNAIPESKIRKFTNLGSAQYRRSQKKRKSLDSPPLAHNDRA